MKVHRARVMEHCSESQSNAIVPPWVVREGCEDAVSFSEETGLENPDSYVSSAFPLPDEYISDDSAE